MDVIINKRKANGMTDPKPVHGFNKKLELVDTWPNIRLAAEAMGEKTHANIYNALRQKRLYKGFYFSYDKLFVKRLDTFI